MSGALGTRPHSGRLPSGAGCCAGCGMLMRLGTSVEAAATKVVAFNEKKRIPKKHTCTRISANEPNISATADVTVAKFPAMVGMTARADFAVDRDHMTRRGARENVYRRIG